MSPSSIELDALLGASVAVANRAGALADLVWRMTADGRADPEMAARLREKTAAIRADLDRMDALCGPTGTDCKTPN